MLPKPPRWLKSFWKADEPAEPSIPPGPSSPHAPTILISGATTRMKSALGGHPWPASYFPFRVGRATSNADEGPHCDLNVPDVEPYQISRHHCSIVWAASVEGFVVQDADSKLGTIVNGVGIGGRSRIKSEPLRKGDNEVVLGGPNSPYRLSIRVP